MKRYWVLLAGICVCVGLAGCASSERRKPEPPEEAPVVETPAEPEPAPPPPPPPPRPRRPAPPPAPAPVTGDVLPCADENEFGRFAEGGGCNRFGCWPPGGSCNPFGCTLVGQCSFDGCPEPITTYQCRP